MNTILNWRVLGMALMLEVIMIAVLLMPASAGSAEAGTCTGQFWSAAHDGSAHDFYGAKGTSKVQNTPIAGSSSKFFVNSTWVQEDADNYAEVGWIWRGGWGSPKMMAVWSKDGVWDVAYYNTLSVNGSYNFEVRRASASNQWKWYLANSLKKTKALDFGEGEAGAQQERWNICDNPDESHWWALKRRTSLNSLGSWVDLELWREDDPDYCLDEISNTQLKVKKGPGTTC